MATSFKSLRAKMSPERRARVEARLSSSWQRCHSKTSAKRWTCLRNT